MFLKHGIFENHNSLNRFGYAFAMSAFSKNCFVKLEKSILISLVLLSLFGLRYNSRSKSSYGEPAFVTVRRKVCNVHYASDKISV